MTAKTKLKNKTDIRVGQKVYDKFADEYEITDLQVLSNKIIHAKAVGQKYNFRIECDLIFMNSKGTNTGYEVFGSTREAKPVFTRKEDAALYYKGYTEDQRYRSIGQFAFELIKQLNMLNKC